MHGIQNSIDYEQEELAVHKKKVGDVKSWLEEALDDPKLSKYRVSLANFDKVC